MIAVLLVELLHCYQFCTGYFESRPTGFGVLRAVRLLALLMLIISAYIPFTKKCWNEIITANFGFEFASLFWTILYFWLSVLF
jgi:hypothetical protein